MAIANEPREAAHGMRARVIWITLGVTFAASLGVVVGQRLSSEAMAVIVGVVAGVAASIPTSLIVVFVATRAAGGARPIEPRRVEPAEPRVVVVQPHGYPGQPAPAWPNVYGPSTPAGYPGMPAPMPRRFTLVGGDGSDYTTIEDAEDTWSR